MSRLKSEFKLHITTYQTFITNINTAKTNFIHAGNKKSADSARRWC